VDMFFSAFRQPSAREGGNLKLLAVSSGTRSGVAPDVRLLRSAGLSGYDISLCRDSLRRAQPRRRSSRGSIPDQHNFARTRDQAEAARAGRRCQAHLGRRISSFVKAEIGKFQQIIKDANLTPQ